LAAVSKEQQTFTQVSGTLVCFQGSSGEPLSTASWKCFCTDRGQARMCCPLGFLKSLWYLPLESKQKTLKGKETCHMWWLVPVIPATWEAEIRRILVQGHPKQKKLAKTPIFLSLFFPLVGPQARNWGLNSGFFTQKTPSQQTSHM
jgi:hypothetical protein